jgi:hypothetical protein
MAEQRHEARRAFFTRRRVADLPNRARKFSAKLCNDSRGLFGVSTG